MLERSVLTSWNQLPGGTFTALVLFLALTYHAIPSVVRRWTSKPSASEKKLSPLRRQMTPIGKFALLSESERNPSINPFFLALANKDDNGMSVEEFRQLWTSVVRKHARFRFNVRECGFEETNNDVAEYILESPHPTNPDEFKDRISSFLSSPLDVTEQPWEACYSTGPLGASGAILHSNELIEQGYKSETVVLFRVHHAICDGMSISVVVKSWIKWRLMLLRSSNRRHKRLGCSVGSLAISCTMSLDQCMH